MINTYSKFFENMTLSRKLSYEDAYKDFINTLDDCVDFYKKDHKQFDRWYSVSAKNEGVDISPEDDFKLVNKYMIEKGWGSKTISELSKGFDGKGNMLTLNQKLIEDNPSRCAPIDYYLFKITDEEFPLQGYSWDGIEDEELIIRYSYGFHKTKYGKVLIEQNMGNIDNFIDKIKKITRKRNKVTIEHLANKLTNSFTTSLRKSGDNNYPFNIINYFYDAFINNVVEYDDNTL